MAVGKKTGGRKKGTPNRATAARVAEVEASGLTPLEYMLAIMRDEAMNPESRFEAAKAAAPYVHPKLAAVDHKSSDGSMTPKPTTIRIIGPDDGSDDTAPAEAASGIHTGKG